MQHAYPMALGIFLGLLISSGIAAVIMRNNVGDRAAINFDLQVPLTASFNRLAD